MDPSIGDATVFIDVAEGNAFSGLLDNFAKELQNENQETTAIKNQHQHNHSMTCPPEIKTETAKQKDTSNSEQAKSEKKSRSKTDRIRCPECQRYTAEDEEQLSRHIRKVHRGENPFLCYMCDYSTYNKVLFEEHVHIHQGIKPYKCSYCSHKSVSKKNLKRHELIHRPNNPLKCGFCDHIARHKKGLAHHLRSFHSKEDSLSCSLCNTMFPTPTHLTDHIAVRKECNYCDFKSCSSSLLEKHKKNKHVDMKKRKRKRDLFKCALCEWGSSVKSKILLHLIHHPNQIIDETLIDVSILRKHGIM